MRNLFEKIPSIKVMHNEPLSRHTSFYIGGNTDYFIKVYSRKALKQVLQEIERKRLSYFLIGAGTNMLVSDDGYKGVCIKLCGIFKKIERRDCFFYCGSGVSLDNFLKKVCTQGYGGAEFLAGIPGTLGGAVKGNAGAFGHSLADITECITVINEKGNVQTIEKGDIGFTYRASGIKNGVIITSAKLRLVRKNRKKIIDTIKKHITYRRQRHPSDYSAGSFFRNPPGCSAGKLIEGCGLKGLRIGDAEVSKKHANYIINRGQAKATDVIKLARKIKRIVRDKKGIILKEEVRILRS